MFPFVDPMTVLVAVVLNWMAMHGIALNVENLVPALTQMLALAGFV
jgi:lipoate-protein ligase B